WHLSLLPAKCLQILLNKAILLRQKSGRFRFDPQHCDGNRQLQSCLDFLLDSPPSRYSRVNTPAGALEPGCIQALPDSRGGRGAGSSHEEWIMEAPKSWSLFRGPPGRWPFGGKTSIKPHRREVQE